MKAIGFKTSLPISEADSFLAFETEKPVPSGRQLLVRIAAVSVNPVDTKVRKNSAKDQELASPKIIGWDAVGIVEAVGGEASLFQPGDTVYYAGDIRLPGSNAEYQLVDERIVGKAPRQLSAEQAAAIPLTALTAWELLFDRMGITDKDKGKTILIIGGAGGVGSIAIQLAKQVAGLNVIATASRPESVEWCRKMGADVVVNHQNLVEEVRNAGIKDVDIILDLVNLQHYWSAMVELVKPQGKIGSISDSGEELNLRQLKGKSVSFFWEMMFTRSSFQTEDMQVQHHILNKVSELLDNGTLTTTLTETIEGLTAENFKKAHAQLESGRTIGKLVVKY
ncbi:zinc-binding alcohol dehydrogenase family protein [Chitinophaga deserti]|uniref:zinc-binding alcohol dehydrogenase family protein n=1 Tax=Chitinophaga deserti TaxID=2164099 RepID=UPI000D6C44EF|nr:zinc-binding alcohol dehydrogenase family protein [Chitinophaga deserti]